MTVPFAVGAEVTRADIPRLCASLADVLRGRPDGGEVSCDVSAARPDVVTVEALARLRLTAGRHGWRFRTHGATDDLLVLFSLMGLGGFFFSGRHLPTGTADQPAPNRPPAGPPPTPPSPERPGGSPARPATTHASATKRPPTSHPSNPPQPARTADRAGGRPDSPGADSAAGRPGGGHGEAWERPKPGAVPNPPSAHLAAGPAGGGRAEAQEQPGPGPAANPPGTELAAGPAAGGGAWERSGAAWSSAWQPRGQTEEREQSLGVEEVVEPGDAAV